MWSVTEATGIKCLYFLPFSPYLVDITLALTVAGSSHWYE